MIIWICKGTCECVAWNTVIELTLRESIIGSNKVHIQNMGSWLCGFMGGQITSNVCALCEEEGHAITNCPFLPFHIKASIARHVELQNVARTLMDQA